MATSTEIKQRANALADKTDVNSITPKEVGGIMYDLASHSENVLRNGGTLGIRKVYESVSAMEADSTNPKDFWGDPIKKGNLVVIYDGTTAGVDNNKIYAFMKPGWELATKLDAAYATKAETDAKLAELGSEVGSLFNTSSKPITAGTSFEGKWDIALPAGNYIIKPIAATAPEGETTISFYSSSDTLIKQETLYLNTQNNVELLEDVGFFRYYIYSGRITQDGEVYFGIERGLTFAVRKLETEISELKKITNNISNDTQELNLKTENIESTINSNYSKSEGRLLASVRYAIGIPGDTTWGSTTILGRYHAIIPIYAGDTIEITASSDDISRIAFLSDYTLPKNGDKVLYSQENGFTARINIAVGATQTFVAPSDAKYICYYVAYDGSFGHLPKSIVINNYRVPISNTINNIYKDISNVYSYIDIKDTSLGLSNQIVYGIYIDSASKWKFTSANSYLISVKVGDVVTLVGERHQYAFLKDIKNIQDGVLADYCDGYEQRFTATSQVDITIPSGCNYLYALNVYQGGLYTEKCFVNGKPNISEQLNTLWSLINNSQSNPKGILQYDAANEKFTFYSLVSANKYASFQIQHYIDNDEIKYQNIWRWDGGKLFTYDNGIFSEMADFIESPENEMAIRFENTSDFTGGWHGDERIDIDDSSFVKFFADGEIITETMMASDFQIICDNFTYIQHSSLHQTSADGVAPIDGHPIIAYHTKINEFQSGVSMLENIIKMVSSQTIARPLSGLVCVAKDSAQYAMLPNAVLTPELTGTYNYYYADNFDANKVILWNENNNIRIEIESEFVEGVDNNDNDMFCVWDRDSDSKYYRGKKTLSQDVDAGFVLRTSQRVKVIF